MTKTDHLRKYNIFNFVLFLWILFLPMKNSVYQISVVLMVIFFIYHSVTFKSFDRIKVILKNEKSIFIAFGFILLSMILSSIIGINTEDSLKETFKFFIRYILIFFVLLYFYDQKFFSKETLLKVIIFSLSIYALDGLYQYITGYDFFKHLPLMGRGLTGPIFNRNIFGFIMAIGTIISFFIIMESSNKRYFIISLILLLLFSFNLFFSLSRASWMFTGTTIVLTIIYTIFSGQLTKNKILLFSTLALGILLLFTTQDDLSKRFFLLIEGNSSNRFEIWLDTLPYIKESPFFGYGIDTFTMLVTNKVSGIHNSTIEILLFLGIFGLITYINLFRIIFIKAFFSKKYYCIFFLLGFLLLLQFDGSLIYSKLNISVFILTLLFIYTDKTNELNEIK
jgi:O-antigen ligase